MSCVLIGAVPKGAEASPSLPCVWRGAREAGGARWLREGAVEVGGMPGARRGRGGWLARRVREAPGRRRERGREKEPLPSVSTQWRSALLARKSAGNSRDRAGNSLTAPGCRDSVVVYPGNRET